MNQKGENAKRKKNKGSTDHLRSAREPVLLLHVVVKGSVGLERLVTYLANLDKNHYFLQVSSCHWQPVAPPLQRGDSLMALGWALELVRLGKPKDHFHSELGLQYQTCMCSLRACTPWHIVRHLGQSRPISWGPAGGGAPAAGSASSPWTASSSYVLTLALQKIPFTIGNTCCSS